MAKLFRVGLDSALLLIGVLGENGYMEVMAGFNDRITKLVVNRKSYSCRA